MRYSEKTVCPGCGLLVAATPLGKLRSHARLTAEAGIEGAACSRPVNPSRRDDKAPYMVAEQYREQTAARLADPDTRLPPHLR